jgi:hypothetical protein
VNDTAGSVTGTVNDTAGSVTGTVNDTAGVVTDAVGTVDGVLDSTGSLGDLVDGVVDTGTNVVPPLPVAPDPATGSGTDPTHPPPADGTRDAPSALRRDSLHTTLPDFHPASAGVPRPDAGGARPGAVPRDGLPFPLDAAAAALSSLTEAGGASLVWAFFALVALLAVTGDRWLRLARAVPPLAPYVVQDGRPG